MKLEKSTSSIEIEDNFGDCFRLEAGPNTARWRAELALPDGAVMFIPGPGSADYGELPLEALEALEAPTPYLVLTSNLEDTEDGESSYGTSVEDIRPAPDRMQGFVIIQGADPVKGGPELILSFLLLPKEELWRDEFGAWWGPEGLDYLLSKVPGVYGLRTTDMRELAEASRAMRS